MVADRSSNMDLSLEDIIKTTQPMRRGAGMARGRAQGKTRGVVRRTTIRQITSRGALMRGGPTSAISRGVGFMSRGRAPSRGPIHISTQSLRNNLNTYNQPDAMTMGPAKLVITNLDHGVTDNDIRELFGEFGSTSEAAIHYDRTGKSLSTGHVIFKRHMDAVKAHKQYNGVNLDGRPMQIVVEPLTNNRGGNPGRGGLMGDAPGMNMNMPFGGRGGGLMGVSPGMNNMNRNNMPYNNSSQGGYNNSSQGGYNNFSQRGYNNSSQGGYMGAHSRLQQPPSLMGGNTGGGGGLMGAAPDMNTNMPYSGRGGGLMGAAPAFNNMNSNNMTPSSGGYMGGQGLLQQPSAFMSGGFGGNNFQNSGRLNFNGRGNYQGNYQGNMSGGFNTPYNNSGNRGSFRGRSMMGSRGGMAGRGSFQARGGGFTGTRGNRGVTRGFGGGRGAGGRPVKKTPTAAELDAELDSYLKEQAS